MEFHDGPVGPAKTFVSRLTEALNSRSLEIDRRPPMVPASLKMLKSFEAFLVEERRNIMPPSTLYTKLRANRILDETELMELKAAVKPRREEAFQSKALYGVASSHKVREYYWAYTYEIALRMIRKKIENLTA